MAALFRLPKLASLDRTLVFANHIELHLPEGLAATFTQLQAPIISSHQVASGGVRNLPQTHHLTLTSGQDQSTT